MAELNPREFTTTRWSVVLRAGGTSPGDSQAALESLCRDYWYPLYAFVRRKGHGPEDASDLTQEFFAKLLANDFASHVSPEGGRFRSYLLTALNRFLINEWEKKGRQKRGGGVPNASIDSLIEEHGESSYLGCLRHDLSPDRLYQKAWAETLLTRAYDRLAAECSARDDRRFPVIRPFLATGDDPPTLADAAAELGMTLPAFKSLLHRFRHRYRELLLDEVSQTVGNPSEVADELRSLLQSLRGG